MVNRRWTGLDIHRAVLRKTTPNVACEACWFHSAHINERHPTISSHFLFGVLYVFALLGAGCRFKWGTRCHPGNIAPGLFSPQLGRRVENAKGVFAADGALWVLPVVLDSACFAEIVLAPGEEANREGCIV